MNSEHYHQSTRTLERFATFQCSGKLLAMASPTETVYWLRARMYIWAPANLLCLLGVLIWPGKFMLQRATRKLKVLDEEFVQVPTPLNTLFKKAPETVAACIHQMIASDCCCKVWPWSWKVCERNTFWSLCSLCISLIPFRVMPRSRVFTGIHLTHLLRRIGCGPSTISATWKASERKASAAGWSTSQATL